MHTFTFTLPPDSTLTPALLAHARTKAVVEHKNKACKNDIFVPILAIFPQNNDNQISWSAVAEYLPRCATQDCHHDAILHLRAGEIGKHLGSIELDGQERQTETMTEGVRRLDIANDNPSDEEWENV